jgi:integrase
VSAAAAPSAAVSAAADGGGFGHVLAGVRLDGPAARLAGLLETGFLTGAGWDPGLRVLAPPPEHPLLGRPLCRVDGCSATAWNGRPGSVCRACWARLAREGMSAQEIASSSRLSAAPARAAGCAVAGCGRAPSAPRALLCVSHRNLYYLAGRPTLEEFLASPRVRPLPPREGCRVLACIRMADGRHGLCQAHYRDWAKAARAGLDRRLWEVTAPAVAEGGLVSLRGLAPLVVTEVLYGIQQHTRAGTKVSETVLRSACDALRRQQAGTIAECDPGQVRGISARALLNAMACHARRALASPDTEHAKDVWDLAVFGHGGNLSFAQITQPWLRQAVKRWARADLPRHRGAGAGNVREAVNSLGWLSGSLRARPDHGDTPAALGRADIENFLNRLAYCQSEGKISHHRRVAICRDIQRVLPRLRALGLTGPGQPAAGLPGDFMMQPGDVPAEGEPAEPGRDLPPQVMRVLCESLPALGPPEIRVAVQIAIDTGRRPEDICALPLDCLARDKDGKPVLVYDNAKAGRLGRRLPIGEATAGVIAAQQHRVRERFPAPLAGELRLLPSPRRNPGGRRPITRQMLDKRHRAWVASLGALTTADGSQFDTSRIVVYCYRHTYAQRHADAGVPVDVLAELLDHRNLNVTRRYYRVEEARRREAVDKITALSFDRHGNRIWRQAAALLESEHARYAIGEVAVPYGTCTEPSNVAAGGGACPVRFRCAGCDHFRTDVSYLPDLTAYLDDLLRTRERLAAITGVDDWARADATPAEEEITRIRRLIGRIKGDVAELPAAERAQADEAVTVMRKHRAVSLGMPSARASQTASEALA